MPDKDGKLSAEERGKAAEWIGKHWVGPAKCPVCAHAEFALSEHLVLTPILVPSVALSVGGPIYPYILLICSNCGYTLPFNSVLMGLSDAVPKKVSNG